MTRTTAVTAALVCLCCFGSFQKCAAQPTLFPAALNLDSKDFESAADKKAPEKLAYISPALGAFVLTGNTGHAIFRYNHDLEVDVHRHNLKFDPSMTSGDFLAYAIEAHPNEFIIFALKQVKGDEGYRIFYAHKESAGKPHTHTHLWCLDAKQFEYHEHHDDESPEPKN